MKKTEETLELMPTQTALDKPAMPQPLASINVEALLNRAIDAKSAVEVLKELRAMELDIQARAARAEFDKAMKAFQAECPVIVKSRGVSDNSNNLAYKYAPIEEVEKVIRPICQKHGFSHKFPKMILGEGAVTAFCEVKHEAGHSETSEVTYRIGTKTKIMSDTQVDAATETFAKRRALCNAYGLVMAGEDTDGAAKPKPAAPSSLSPSNVRLRTLAQQLWDLLKPVRGAKADWTQANQWLWKEEILDSAADEAMPHNVSETRLLQAIEKTKTSILKYQ